MASRLAFALSFMINGAGLRDIDGIGSLEQQRNTSICKARPFARRGKIWEK